MKKVSILGCGWLGTALKEQLEKSYKVTCLSKDIGMNSMVGYYNCSTLVIAIPPSTENYLSVLEDTIFSLESNNPPQIIFLSSTSFYRNKKSVVEAESLMLQLHYPTTILRLGGLMGYDRIAGKYTAGKTLKQNAPTNYVHRNDVVNIIELLIEKNIQEKIYTTVAPIQTTKKEIFDHNAKKFGFEKTHFEDEKATGQKLSSQKLIEELGYSFEFEDVFGFWG